MRVQRKEYRNNRREQSAGSEQNARVYRDEGTESLQSRECSARGRDESTESQEYRELRVQSPLQMREYTIESTKYNARVQRDESTETTGECKVQDQSRMRECTEMRRLCKVQS